MGANTAGLVAACADARLLAFPLWPKQRELLASVEQTRLSVWNLGRRSGKTSCAALVLVWDAALRPHLRKYVRPGERRYCIGVATNLRQARLLIDAARTIVKASPMLASMLQDETDDELVFPDASVVAFPATARGVRGWAVSSLVFDEMAHMLDTDGNQAAEPLWRALLPAAAQFGSDSRIIAASTPYGSEGLFHDLYTKAERGEIEDAVSLHATTAEANPTISPDFLRREFERDPESYAGEYEAAFLGSGGAYLDPERIAACVAHDGDLARIEVTEPLVAADLAFTSDPAAAVVIGRDPANASTLRVAAVRRWTPQRSLSFDERRTREDTLLGEIAELARAYGTPSLRQACRVVVDQHLAAPVRAFFGREHVPVTVLPLSAESKSAAFGELKARILERSIELPDNPDLLAELRALRTQWRAGRSQVITPRTSRGHSDIAVALALACYEQRHVAASEMHAEFVEHGRFDSEPGSLNRMADEAFDGLRTSMRL